jgi:hypothetical protein
MIVKAKAGLDDESLMDELVNRSVNKNLIVEVESAELAEDFDLEDEDDTDDEELDELIKDGEDGSEKS